MENGSEPSADKDCVTAHAVATVIAVNSSGMETTVKNRPRDSTNMATNTVVTAKNTR